MDPPPPPPPWEALPDETVSLVFDDIIILRLVCTIRLHTCSRYVPKHVLFKYVEQQINPSWFKDLLFTQSDGVLVFRSIKISVYQPQSGWLAGCLSVWSCALYQSTGLPCRWSTDHDQLTCWSACVSLGPLVGQSVCLLICRSISPLVGQKPVSRLSDLLVCLSAGQSMFKSVNHKSTNMSVNQ